MNSAASSTPAHRLETTPIRSFAEYRRHRERMADTYRRRLEVELALIGKSPVFHTTGYCQPCGRQSRFRSDFLYASGQKVEGKRLPNWRERVLCDSCGLNNRIRGSLHFLAEHLKPNALSRMFISEESTPLYHQLRRRYPLVTGSEYLGDRVPFGERDALSGYRNESITKLSFANNSFDFILSFDVFEHVPEYQAAFQECLRCLKPGGTLLFSVPFDSARESNLIRARLREDGTIEHLCEPEYHGDPVNDAGCLCFYHFGWSLLDEIRTAGFSDACAHLYWSDRLGYLGQEQMLLTATKGLAPAS